MFVGAAGDAGDLGWRQKLRGFAAARGRGAEENAGGFVGHEGGGEDSVGARAEGDEAVVFEEDDARRLAGAFDEGEGFAADGLREFQAGIGVGNEDGGFTAADDFVGEEAAGGEGFCPLRTEEAVDGIRVRVADEVHSGEREEEGVEDGFDGGFFRGGVFARSEEGFVDGGVGQGFFVEEREDFVEAAGGDVFRGERGEVGAAGLHEEGGVADAGGGVAFTEDGECAFFAAEVVGEGEQRLERGRRSDGGFCGRGHGDFLTANGR